MYRIDRHQLDRLVRLLAEERTVIGPTASDGAVRLREIRSADDLPTGWLDEQSPGSYRIRRDAAVGASFAYAVGPDSAKSVFHRPERAVFAAERDEHGRVVFHPAEARADAIALVGVRPCELAAVAAQDRVLQGGEHVDSAYASARSDVVVVAVDCGRPAATCFCTSMGTGPRAEAGFDVALTEVDDGAGYVARHNSEVGAELLRAVGAVDATDGDIAAATDVIDAARAAMAVRLDPDRIRTDLAANAKAAEWDAVARRCLACGNCTAVCPTCFCTTVVDRTDSDSWERTRVWASCFELGFSEVHGHAVRASVAARYRQWATHKLSTWFDQFGSSGCVGCGRCIAWCPVGIDLIEEATRVAENPTIEEVVA
jgi:ferredoxin